MLELKQCCSVPFPEKLFEAYEIKDNVIYANVNASKVIDMIKRFVCMHDEPVFFILELPRKDYDGITESKTLKNAPEDFDVYYMDGMNAQNACDCLDAIGAFLVGDGMNTFGFGCHQSQEEILFGKYNVMTVFAKDPDAYRPFMESFEIPYTDKLITAWDTFDAQHPGECELCISPNTGKTIYDIPELYKDFGMYLYEERKEYQDGIEKPITYDELIGKVLLVGITYYTSDDQFIEQKQLYGTVTEATKAQIRIKQKDGTEFTLPSDLSSTKRARPGEYKLRSTGEVVVDPDFLATWNLYKGE
jgi:hypothetical protein